MLARLESLEGVEHAQIDYHGELLRLGLSHDGALAPATNLLSELGYGAGVAAEVDAAAVVDWYDIGSVGDLSRVEAGVIADRIVPPFARSRSLTADQIDRVRAAVVDALHGSFVSHALDSGPSLGAFRASCERAVEGRVRPILGTDAGAALARLLSVDMSEDHRSP